MNLQSRIKEAIDGSGLSRAEFSRAAKVSQSAINQLVEGKTKSLKADTAAHIEINTGYRATWLALGKGPKKAFTENGDQIVSSAAASPISYQRPLINDVIGRLAESIQVIPNYRREAVAGILRSLTFHPDAYADCACSLEAFMPPEK
jgi:transcriptional regulator with XRE-family HTH domain